MAENLFEVSLDGELVLLHKDRSTELHRAVNQLLFFPPGSHKDIKTKIDFFRTMVREPDEDNWSNLKRLLQ